MGNFSVNFYNTENVGCEYSHDNKAKYQNNADASSIFSADKKFRQISTISDLSISNITKEIVKNANKGFFTNFFEKIGLIRETSSTCRQLSNGLFLKANTIYTELKEKLKAQNIKFSTLNEDEQQRYLKIILMHSFGKLSNEDYLIKLNNFSKERLTHIVKENTTGLKKYFSFLRASFKEATLDTAKLNNAAVGTSAQTGPKDIANKLLLLYSTSIPDRRKEILSEALKNLPDDITQQEILELVISSEDMSVLEINFAKDYIEKSNLPEEVKKEKLKMLEKYSTPSVLRSLSLEITTKMCKYKNTQFNRAMYYIEKEDGELEYIQDEKKQLNRVNEKLQEEKKKYKDTISLEKIKLDKLDDKNRNAQKDKNHSNSIREKLYTKTKEKLLNLDAALRAVESKISLNESAINLKNNDESLHLSIQSNRIVSCLVR